MRRTIILHLPLPPRMLHPNGGQRWNIHARARAVREAKEIAWIESKSQWCDEWPWEHCIMDAMFDVRRRHDDDNLIAWLKYYRDGISAAGVVRNDSEMMMGRIAQRIVKEGFGIEISLREERDSDGRCVSR